ncbi:MFS transporter, partial [Ilumatobacter sp.]|uniref:MFS transporter n=1 Tax=Ilumatobacter sp. TaxID=1967498 RepID=UPI003C6ADA4A
RKGALQAGLLMFLIGAAIATTADSSSTLIFARAVMGLAAAFVMPSTLSILTNVFPTSERPKAIAVWAGVSGGGAAIGPVASGWLLEHFWWGSVFLVNVPIIVGALVAGAFIIPTSKNPDNEPIDVPGALLSIAALTTLTYSIIEAPHNGWTSSETIGLFLLSVLSAALFIMREASVRVPMLDLHLFRDRRFSVASVGMGLTYFAMFGTFFLMAQYLQLVLDYSPLESGLIQLPFAFIIVAVAPRVPSFVERYGVSWVVPAGLTSTAIGLGFLSRLEVDSSLVPVYMAIVPLAVGMAITITPLTTLIMSSVPLGRAGVGSAMNDTTRELGGALGVAVLGSILTSQYTSGISAAVSTLPEEARGIANSGLSGALMVSGHTGGGGGDSLAAAATQAFLDGFSVAAIVASAVLLAAAIAARFLLPRGTNVYSHS